MKLLSLTAAALLFASVATASLTVDCTNGGASRLASNAAWSRVNTTDLFLTHNFASASLNCDSLTEEAVRQRRTFRCAGIWSVDFRRPDLTLGTVAVVEFIQKSGDSWSARYQASYDYDREDVSMTCTIKTN